MRSVSRRHPRFRTRLTATVEIAGLDSLIVCPTRDISEEGCFLDTAAPMPATAKLTISIMDHHTGNVIEVTGEVARTERTDDAGSRRGVAVYVPDPPMDWVTLVKRIQSDAQPTEQPAVRLRVLVVADEAHQRSALALYVTSGWDVRLASDLRGAKEALAAVSVNVVIVETTLDDPQWRHILTAAKDTQPEARRLLRCDLQDKPAPEPANYDGLFHRALDQGSGMDALLDAVSADYGTA